MDNVEIEIHNKLWEFIRSDLFVETGLKINTETARLETLHRIERELNIELKDEFYPLLKEEFDEKD